VKRRRKKRWDIFSVAKSGLYPQPFAGFVDPAASTDVIGNAGLQIAEYATIKYSAQVAGLGASRRQQPGAPALTGNILAAVMTLMPLFVDSGPTPEQMILRQ